MLKIVCISDTHRLHRQLKMPEGDILIHAGDIGCERGFDPLIDLNEWFKLLPYEHKIVIPGNHDFAIENSPLTAKALLNKAELLIDEECIINGVKYWGSPCTPFFHDWAWNEQRGEPLKRIWAKIPMDTDVLITHGPPYGILDEVIYGGKNVGCEELRKRVLEVQPKVHVFGHIHEGYGYFSEGKTQYVNASILSHGAGLNLPQVIEIK
jgi:Icc-related predicted phosphoesterase